jgi:hypothetical protein
MALTWQDELSEILRLKDGQEIHFQLMDLIENEKQLSFEEGKAAVDVEIELEGYEDAVSFHDYVRGM